MSLILDALRRAEAERERGSVPGLHSHAAPSLADDDAPRSRIEPWHWMVIGVGIGIVVAAVWYVVGRFAAQQEAAMGAGTSTVVAAPPAVASPSAAPSAVSNAAANLPPTAAPAAAAPAAPPPIADAPPAPAAATATPTAPSSDAPLAQPAPWPPAERRGEPRKPEASRPAAREPAVPPPQAPLYTREQLPEAIRAQFPTMTFGGSMYSASASNRTLIINGQIHRENDLVAPDLSIEQIRVKGAVFRFKGYRVEVPY